MQLRALSILRHQHHHHHHHDLYIKSKLDISTSSTPPFTLFPLPDQVTHLCFEAASSTQVLLLSPLTSSHPAIKPAAPVGPLPSSTILLSASEQPPLSRHIHKRPARVLLQPQGTGHRQSPVTFKDIEANPVPSGSRGSSSTARGRRYEDDGCSTGAKSGSGGGSGDGARRWEDHTFGGHHGIYTSDFGGGRGG